MSDVYQGLLILFSLYGAVGLFQALLVWIARGDEAMTLHEALVCFVLYCLLIWRVYGDGGDYLKYLLRRFTVKVDGSEGNDDSRPEIVCLCGSTRFYKEYQQAYFQETLAGNIVLSVGFYPHASEEVHGHNIGISPEQKIALDELHLRKIDLADRVLILNVGGYIGESTARELEHARSKGKMIEFLEPDKAPKRTFAKLQPRSPKKEESHG